MRQCWACFWMRSSISWRRSEATRKRSSAKPRVSESRVARSFQKVLLTSSAVCLPISPWKSICKQSSRDLRRVPILFSRALTLPSGCAAGFSFQANHLHRGESGLKAFVTGLQPGAIQCLFQIFACKHAVGVGHTGFLRRLSDSSCDLSGDVLVMVGFAANQAAEGDDGIKLSG